MHLPHRYRFNPFRHTKLRTATSRVRVQLFFTGHNRLAVDRFEHLISIDAALHDPIFKGMETDNHCTAFEIQKLRQAVHRLLQIFEFVVDRDSNRLKRSRCRIDRVVL